MELVDRYLHAIEFWLPNQQKHDIAAELFTHRWRSRRRRSGGR
jgi:hypothetical protein